MHFWGQNAWRRITFGDLVGSAVDPRPSKPRGRPESHPEQRQVRVLLLFVAPEWLSRGFGWETLRSECGSVFPRRQRAQDHRSYCMIQCTWDLSCPRRMPFGVGGRVEGGWPPTVSMIAVCGGLGSVSGPVLPQTAIMDSGGGVL